MVFMLGFMHTMNFQRIGRSNSEITSMIYFIHKRSDIIIYLNDFSMLIIVLNLFSIFVFSTNRVAFEIFKTIMSTTLSFVKV